jgi:hypothetical protein
MVRGGLTAANLKLVIDLKHLLTENAANNFMQNQAIDSYTDKSRFISLVETTLERCLAIVQKL